MIRSLPHWFVGRPPEEVAAAIQKNIDAAFDVIAAAYPLVPRLLL